MPTNRWHTLSPSDVEKKLATHLAWGLKTDEARSRLRLYGPNELPEGKRDPLFFIFLRQFQSPLIYVLLIAGIIVFAIGEITDGFVLLAVVILNSIIGTIQEGKAQRTLAALKKFTKTAATVIREGKEIIIPATEIVPGDLVVLFEGEGVPADARIIEAHNLTLNEAALTGESIPIHKKPEALSKKDLATAEQTNMVFKGTTVFGGNGKALVVSIGAETVIGKISKEIALIDTEIPLKADIRRLSRIIIVVVIASSIALFSLGSSQGREFIEMFTLAISTAVSIIPEGLPIVITLVLATGVWRMAKRNALIKKLQAVEALGQARVIAVDKTGTITKNELIVRKIFVDGKIFEVSGDGYDPKGEIKINRKAVYALNHPELILCGKIAALNANARTIFSNEDKTWKIAGDPTEAAMLVLAKKIGFDKDDFERESPRIAEIPFDYRTRYHIVSHRISEKAPGKSSHTERQFVSIAGAPETVISLADKVFFVSREREEAGGEVTPFTQEKRAEIEHTFRRMSQDGLRVVAFGFYEAPFSKHIDSWKPRGITLVGLFGMADSIRPEVREATRRAHEAGVRIVMITGDHKITAAAIAKEAGIYEEKDNILTGEDLVKLDEKNLERELARTTVFARVSPEDKMKIIGAYRRRGEIIAMTGDGVNDAPSLVAADLGVAMGKIGTEVAKEASDIVLLDDNFGSIVSAIEEGRNIYKTIKKVLLYLFSTSVGELLTIFGAFLILPDAPAALLAPQILWLNLVTDGFLDVSLAMDPKEAGLLKGGFQRPNRFLVDSSMLQRIPGMALSMAIGTLILFSIFYRSDPIKAWTISLTTLAAFQWFNAWNCRSDTKSIFRTNPFSNKFLVGATVIVILLQIFAVYTPFMQRILRLTPLSLGEWLTAIAIAFSIVLVEEGRKFLYRRFFPSKA